MQRYNEIQTQFISSYDKRKICSFDIEFIDSVTKALIHQSARFLYVIKGKATIVINGQEYQLKPKCIICILPWDTTVIKRVDEPLQIIKVIYNYDFVSEAMHIRLNVFHQLISIVSSVTDNPVIYLNDSENKIIIDLLNTIKMEVGVESLYDDENEKELSEVYVMNKLIEILIQCKRFIFKKECITTNGKEIDLDNRPAIFKYIYSHLSDKISLSKVASIFYMSESAVSKYILDVTGMSFTDLVNEMRITKVIDILTYTDLSLNDIAMISGFVDASYLVKVFNTRVGISPSEYRKIYKAKENLFKDKDKTVSFEIVNYITENYTNDIRVTDIADKFNMSVVEVNRTLMFQLEKNFEELLHYLRINKACELLLAKKEEPLVDIGMDVGYNTVKTFTRNFIRLKGMTPSDFRKNITLQISDETIYESDE